MSFLCRGGEIGRRTCLRSKRGNPWRFESSPRHKLSPRNLGRGNKLWESLCEDSKTFDSFY